ncbi:adenomatous polyposis coli protein 2 isoform X1 [Sarcophilus harrisii]|uniref:Adenomatous polyposis coli protein 2 n=2 Tax=Sarcophilus harrisii TaxID=9305 RepID=A0A7N4PJG3_SARHA|nr:adenomatous polyposis coli protein 2 isoform X1 [Sarcophilus harrisii]
MGLLWFLSFLHSTFFGDEVLEELKMSGPGPTASYEQLVRQVEALSRENTHLRRELQDNSSHLSKLENETSDMKEVLKHLQGKLEQEARAMVSSGRTELLEQLKALQMDITNLYNLKFQPPALAAEPGSRSRSRSPEGSPLHCAAPAATAQGLPKKREELGELSRATVRLLEELDKERCFLLAEIEKEEQEKLWYYGQLQSLSQRLDELPQSETFSMQTDLIRQQLEFEAQHIRALMEERFGTSDEMVQRAQIRASRLEQIEKELAEAQAQTQTRERAQQPQPEHQTLLGIKPTGAEGDGEPEAPTHPEDGTSQLSNSKVEVVFWLLSMLATRDKEDMARTLLAMSSSQESCVAMRRSGCLPLLLQILHDADREAGPAEGAKDARMRANAALHNIIFSQPDEGQAKKEMRVLHVLEQIRSYCETCWDWLRMQGQDGGQGPEGGAGPVPIEPQICQATCAVMKLSFDEEYRRAMNELGGLQAVAELLQVDYEMHKMTNDPLNLALRRYAGMALTNLTFGDVVNKATLCARRGCMQAIVAQLASDSEELHQVVSSILRNLSWRADINSKKVLREVGSMTGLMQCALRATKESTLKSVLSALWNLSAHSTENKAAICLVDGALGFLVSTLTYKCQSNSLAIIESGGGILRNVSSLIATREDYRQVLRDHNCLQTLLQHLRSHSLTIVSNACGTLWNLSARSPRDQELLWDLGAVSMLRNLIHSKHKMIAMGSAAALRNLLTHRPLKYKDTAAVISPGSCMPSLYVRKQKALEAELDARHLAEALDTMEKQSLKGQVAKKPPLRHLDSLVKDYASDSGCFDDEDVPALAPGVEVGNPSVLSMFLNSSFLQGQALPRMPPPRRGPEAEKEDGSSGRGSMDAKKGVMDGTAAAAEKLATKLSVAVAKIDKLVEDISALHTSSEDSFSLSSGDHGLDWPSGPGEVREARAQSCSPCRLPEAGRREGVGRAHPLLRLKAAYTSLSNDSLNSSSTSDGYCPREHMKPSPRASFADYREELQRYQQRPSRLDLKNVVATQPERREPPAQEPAALQGPEMPDGLHKPAVFPGEWAPKDGEGKLAPDAQVHTIKLSPSYQHVPLLEGMAKVGAVPFPGTGGSSMARKQAWLPPGTLKGSEGLSKIPEKLVAPAPPAPAAETLQKYSVEDTPICFSRCSSLSSLSSADHGMDGRSRSEDNDLDSDSSLEILEEPGPGEGEDDGVEDWRPRGAASLPVAIPAPRGDRGDEGASPSQQEDMTPSSSSENYIQETPLVMSRCSSVSSLGSFESPSIASSIQSDPCSEMVSGTVSPSELPDSPGQTMPPSRSKTPLPERETSQFNLQWENNVKKFMDITDFKERFQLPPDLDSTIYFTVEKPDENFSCASSLSALPLHEHYVQKDVELKLLPPFPERGGGLHFAGHEKREEPGREERLDGPRGGRPRIETHSEDDLEILKECISSAMPSRFRKVKTALVPGLPAGKKGLHVPVYMLVPAHAHPSLAARTPRPSRSPYKEEDSFTDSAEGTPVNFSSATSLSDETLQYPSKDSQGQRAERREPVSRRVTSSHSTPTKMAGTYKHRVGGASLPLSNRNAEPSRGSLKNLPSLELTVSRPRSAHSERDSRARGDSSHPSGGHGDVAFQSFCHTTPTEEAVYCFYENDSDEASEALARKAPTGGRAPKKDHRAGKKETEPKPKAGPPASMRPRVPTKSQHKLIADETPPCYSLSSSVSSLSDLDLSDRDGGQPPNKGGPLHLQARKPIHTKPPPPAPGRDSSPSSPSLNSDEDLLQRCIGSAMPKRQRHAARHRKAERKPKQGSPKAAGSRERKAEIRRELGEEAASDRASDLDSVEWQAIQDGANSIVTWLHQAAAAATSLSREPSSECDSILSFVSGLSVGSTLQLTLGREEQKRRGKEAGGEVEKKEQIKTAGESKKGGEARTLNRRISRGPEKPANAQKPVSNLPAVFRGRTVIYMPTLAKGTPKPRSPPKKAVPKTEPPAKPLPLNQQRSRSLHRPGKISEMAELTLPKRSATPPARMAKTPSSGSSQTSTPSQPSSKKSPPSSQTSRPVPPPGGKVGTSSPQAKPVKALLSRQHKTQKSPVRIPFMQKPARKPFPGKNTPPVPEEQGAGAKAGARLNLVRVPSTRSSGSESDRSGFLRQLTFIKESSNLLLRHRSEATAPLSQNSSPRRSRPSVPAVFLCSSRCEELKAAKAGPPPSPRASPGERLPRRTSSESPSRLPVKKAAPAPEPFKRYSSSPHINVVKRSASPAPTLQQGAETGAGRRRSDGEAQPPPQVGPGEGRAAPSAATKGTWRRIRDEDIPQILKSTLPPTALPLVGTVQEDGPAPQRKTSDAVVQTEDFSTSKTNSSTSPTLENREPPKNAASGPAGGAQAPFIGSDVDGLSSKVAAALAFAHEGLTAPAGGFPSSRHSSPSRAARVTPFNYIPSPMVVPAASDKAVEKAVSLQGE